MGDKCPRDPEYARISFEWSFGELGELAIIAAGEVVVDFSDLFVHNVKIIDQPLCGRRDHLVVAHGLAYCAIGPEERPAVVSEPGRQRTAGRGFGRDALRGCEAPRVLLQPFDAEELAPDRLLSIPRRNSRRPPEGAKDETSQK
jgi:hypothetical protein